MRQIIKHNIFLYKKDSSTCIHAFEQLAVVTTHVHKDVRDTCTCCTVYTYDNDGYVAAHDIDGHDHDCVQKQVEVSVVPFSHTVTNLYGSHDHHMTNRDNIGREREREREGKALTHTTYHRTVMVKSF